MGTVVGQAGISMMLKRIAWSSCTVGEAWVRRVGVWGLSAAFLSACVLAGGVLVEMQNRQLRALASREAASNRVVPLGYAPSLALGAAAGAQDGRGKLRAFDALLLAHDDIPQLIQDVLLVAEEEGVTVQRGDYRPEADRDGGFLRYRMSLPLQGKPSAIHRFIRKVLVTQRSMALERVQFKRENIRAGEMEARIQWVVFTRIPAGELEGQAVAQPQKEVP